MERSGAEIRAGTFGTVCPPEPVPFVPNPEILEILDTHPRKFSKGNSGRKSGHPPMEKIWTKKIWTPTQGKFWRKIWTST
jgi:hypothetical protein